jgi:hypothetical protein
MNFSRNMLALVAMAIGSLGALGCNQTAASSGAEEAAAAAAAPVVAAATPADGATKTDESVTILAKASAGVTTKIPDPPKRRYESPGRAPSRDHVWQRGNWRWNEREYVWVPGHWERAYAPKAPPAGRFENRGRAPSDRHVWIDGYWRWDGKQYVWVSGHWDIKRNGRTYVGPHYNKVNGRWQYMPGHWAKR